MGRFARTLGQARRAYEVARRLRARQRAAQAALNQDEPPSPAMSTAADSTSAQPPAPLPPPSVDDLVPRGLRIAGAWSWRLLLIAAVTVGLLWLLDRFLILVAPLLVGLLLAGLLAPALRLLLKLRLNRTLATLLVLVGGLALVGGTLTLVVNQIINGADQMAKSVTEGVESVQSWLLGPPLNLSEEDLSKLLKQGQNWVTENTESLTSAAVSTAGSAVQFITGFILALVATFFFLRDGHRIWAFLVGMVPQRARAPLDYAGEGAWRTLSGYVRATVLVAFIDAVGIGIGLMILQVPFALPLAALVFLGAFVPIVGAFVSGAVAVLVALLDEQAPGLLEGGGFVKALMVLGLVILVQQIEGNILQPVIMSRAVQIHPLAVIVAVTLGILLAGIIGALVAVPVVAVLNTVVRRINAYYRRPSPLPRAEPATSE
jgi:predicted PurR-regulated permease PerM